MNDQSPKKLYVDVSQLIHWPGRLTGIPRVMNELATRFIGHDKVVFVAWVKELQQFCEVDFQQTMAQRGKNIVYVKHGNEAPVVATKVLLSSQPSLAARAWKKAIRIVKALVRRSARLNPRFARELESRLVKVRLSQNKVVQFATGDQLFIPWGEWWDERFTNRLLGLHDNGVHLIQIIHDIAPTVCPQFFEQVAVNPADYNSKILPIASLVLVVSENTKRELTEWLQQNNLNVPPVRVFRNGEDFATSRPARPTDTSFVDARLRDGDFLLTVGTIELKKNHLLYYYVYKLAKARGVDLPKLVIVGRLGWMSEVAHALMTKDPEVKDKFIFLLDSSDEELSWLYDHCLFTILASFHEGWGIPVAESISHGVPCLCSNTSSMVEIAEGFVEHFSPASSDELLAGILHWLDPEKLQIARSKTTEYKQFSWDESFKQVTRYIEETIHG